MKTKKINKTVEVEKTRKRISDNWKAYETKKQKIQNSRKLSSLKKVELIKKAKNQTVVKNSGTWSGYRMKVYNKDDQNPLTKTKEYKIHSGFESHFKVKKATNEALYKALTRLAKQSELRYILVSVYVYFPTTDTIQIISQNFTPLALERITQQELDSILNQFIKKQAYGFNGEYEVKQIFLRAIYENTKTTIKTKVFRKYRKSKK